MQRFLQFAFVFGLTAFFAFGAKPIAAVTSAEPFTLNGHSLNTPGVTSFPVVLGDTVSTSNGTAVLVFPEGSTVKVGANSSVRVSGLAAKPKVVLLAGALDFKLIPGSAVSVTNLDKDKESAAADDATPAVTGAAAPNARRPLLTSPKFLVPAAGVGTAGLATALLRLPPVSRHL